MTDHGPENTSHRVCFWCGERPVGDVPIIGASLHYAPCDTCGDQMAERFTVAVVEVRLESRGEQVGLALDEDRMVYPTGRWAVVERSFFDLLSMPYTEFGFAFVDSGVWEALGLDSNDVEVT